MMADLNIPVRERSFVPVYFRRGWIAHYARRLYRYKRFRNRFVFDLGYGVLEGWIHPYTKQPIGELHPGTPIGRVVSKNDDGTVTIRIGGAGKAE